MFRNVIICCHSVLPLPLIYRTATSGGCRGATCDCGSVRKPSSHVVCRLVVAILREGVSGCPVVMDFSSGLLPSKQTPSDATAESYWYLLDSPDVSPRTVVSRGKAKRETSTLPQVQRLLHNELPPEY
ncbi:uncharacterized protein [Dermacentor albipictus]|uniref:uncharacterized protein isoform X1 n=1 Tax=Dermacentor albipictus TaxID=60249 RepID=UPI0031FD7BA2